jgi:hypothetical protein
LVEASLPAAVRNRSFIVNDVPEHLKLQGTDENMIASVVSGMLQAVLSNSRESCVKITAAEVHPGLTMQIYVKDTGCFSTFALACDLQNVFPVAEKIGGYLSISSEKQMNTTITFSFPLRPNLLIS